MAQRRSKLHLLADAIADKAGQIAQVLTREQGKPLQQAELEVGYSEIFCRFFADLEMTDEVLQEDDQQRVELQHLPFGVVAAITTWNFPFLIAIYKLSPALMTGNTLVLKPAPTTPLTTLMLGVLVKDIFPAGVVNIIADNNDLGPQLSAHPGVAKISFTGSTPVGRNIMAGVASSLKSVTLELGGNDAAVVLDDADPKQIAAGIFGAAFLNSGQVCIALKRLYVHDKIYEQMCDEIAALAKQAVIGDGTQPESQYGPVQNQAQFEKVQRHIEDARQNGTIIAGGDVPDRPGYLVPLTVVRDIHDGTAVVDEETFGPVLPVIRYSDLDQVIRRANNLVYGLGGSVWSGDLERAQEVASRMHCGTVWINQHCAFGPNIPLPTAKQSGLGIEWGKQGFEEYTTPRVVNINKKLSALPTHMTIQRVNPDIDNIEGKNFFLIYQCDGGCVAEQGYNQTRIQPGDMVLLDSMQPFRIHYGENAHQFCFHIPREMALHNWRYTRVKLAEKISVGSGLGGLLTPLLRETARIGATIPKQFEDDYLLNAILMLLEPIFTQKQDRANQYQSIYLQRAMAFIDQNLCNTEIASQAVADHLHVSLRHMQRLFKSRGTSVSKLILEKRICACAKDMIDPHNAGVNVTTIAFYWGFKDSSCFSRVFRNYYGISPSEYRKNSSNKLPGSSAIAPGLQSGQAAKDHCLRSFSPGISA